MQRSSTVSIAPVSGLRWMASLGQDSAQGASSHWRQVTGTSMPIVSHLMTRILARAGLHSPKWIREHTFSHTRQPVQTSGFVTIIFIMVS